MGSVFALRLGSPHLSTLIDRLKCHLRRYLSTSLSICIVIYASVIGGTTAASCRRVPSSLAPSIYLCINHLHDLSFPCPSLCSFFSPIIRSITLGGDNTAFRCWVTSWCPQDSRKPTNQNRVVGEDESVECSETSDKRVFTVVVVSIYLSPTQHPGWSSGCRTIGKLGSDCWWWFWWRWWRSRDYSLSVLWALESANQKSALSFVFIEFSLVVVLSDIITGKSGDVLRNVLVHVQPRYLSINVVIHFAIIPFSDCMLLAIRLSLI